MYNVRSRRKSARADGADADDTNVAGAAAGEFGDGDRGVGVGAEGVDDEGEGEAETALRPLDGLDRLSGALDIFLHEGPKTAARVRSMLDTKQPHPWRRELVGAVAHLGWCGAVDNIDWTPLAELPSHVTVTIIATYTSSGEAAVSAISQKLKRPLRVVRFDDKFPAGFNVAHEWPAHGEWWRRNNEYIGPTINDLTSSATWATSVVEEEKKKPGRPAYRIRGEFAAEWHVAVDPPVFVHRDLRDRLYTNEKFNRAVRPFSDAEDTAKLMVKRGGRACVAGVIYRPCRERVLTINRMRVVNTFRPGDIVPVKGDIAPWVDFISNLIPDEGERREVLRWCATLIARPEVRMLFGLLLISETQGVGKTTLGRILAHLLGPWNVSHPNEKEIVSSSFNGWMAHKRLAIVNEIYSGQSRDAYDKLKTVITDEIIHVNEKFMPAYDLENWVHILACSNSLKALHLDDDDRRWLVPTVSEKQRPAAYWRDFYAWLDEGGYALIAHWAEEFVKEHGPVQTGEHAPMTNRKREVIMESRSEGTQIAHDLAAKAMELKREGKRVVLLVREVREPIAMERCLTLNDRKLEKPLTVRRALVAGGLQEPARDGDPRMSVDGRPEYVVANFPIGPAETWGAIKEAHMKPGQLLAARPKVDPIDEVL